MNGDRDFVRALSEFLALHTEQSSGYLGQLIESFLRGARGRPNLDQAAKEKITSRLKAEMEAYDNVPSFLQNYLFTHLAHGEWPPQAVFIASRYLSRQSNDRFIAWQQRQGHIAELAASRSAEPNLVFARCFTAKARGLCFVGGALPASSQIMIWPSTQCLSMSYSRAPLSNWDLVRGAHRYCLRICAV
jgi:hypothetical protein